MQMMAVSRRCSNARSCRASFVRARKSSGFERSEANIVLTTGSLIKATRFERRKTAPKKFAQIWILPTDYNIGVEVVRKTVFPTFFGTVVQSIVTRYKV